MERPPLPRRTGHRPPLEEIGARVAANFNPVILEGVLAGLQKLQILDGLPSPGSPAETGPLPLQPSEGRLPDGEQPGGGQP